MKKYIISILLLIFSNILISQNNISGVLLNTENIPIEFVNVVLYLQSDSSMIKVTTTDSDGNFVFNHIPSDSYWLEASFIGFENFFQNEIIVRTEDLKLGVLTMKTSAIELETAVIKARRSIVEVKPDRMVFNVEGTINSAGDNALGLMRKAPGVIVDNNDNISVLSRSGVKVYIDGKKLPLSGDELSAYLKNIPAEQIDRMDIITNPGAKYEAEGNAGIIDVRLKKDKSIGSNGSISGTLSHGKYLNANTSFMGNYRTKKVNVFTTLGYADGESLNNMYFRNNQNGLITDESNNWLTNSSGVNYRLGTDFFIHKNHTIGLLFTGNNNDGSSISNNEVIISRISTPNSIDSILIAKNSSNNNRDNRTLNLNYVFDTKKHSLNIDLDYGKYKYHESYVQPNRYYDATKKILQSEVLTEYETPVNIDIYTAKVDYETKLFGGQLELGAKYSKVVTDNTFLFFDILSNNKVQNNQRSNTFDYDETVVAEYISYRKSINSAISFSAGIRVETTNSNGDLTAFDTTLMEDPVISEYTNFFPTLGLTYQLAPMHTLSLNYGKRINRPDYNVLNPFRVQISELSFSKGNAFLKPEIVNNIELGYTMSYRYNFKVSYSKTDDQITRLIGPDKNDPRAGYITWENLAKQEIYNFNASLPIAINKWWNAYFNLGLSYINNQADYGDGAIVDIQATNYTLFQQQTFTLPKGFVGEVSGYYSGPGVWGGVFLYDPSWSLNLGLQKKFLKDKLNVKLAANDLFFTSGWSGVSVFDGLSGEGHGDWDSRKVSLSLSYSFGNINIKTRKRKTGIEEESKRVGSSGK